jgi:signal transduction histidine kinase
MEDPCSLRRLEVEKLKERALFRYGSALGFLGAALCLAHLLWPFLDRSASALFLAAIMLAAFFGGLGPALLATAISVCLVDYYIVPPFYHVEFTFGSLVRALVFSMVGVLVSWLNDSRRKLMVSLRERDQEREQLLSKISVFNDQLKKEISEKTNDLSTAHSELLLAQQRLASAERMEVVGQLAASLAHEIGTPLNAIAGHMQLLSRNHPRDLDTQRRVQIINQQLEFIVSIVRNLLERTHKRQPVLAQTDLNRLLSSLCALVAPMLEQRDIRYKLSLDPDAPDVLADRKMLQQVFLNLINNSVDAMPAGGHISIMTRYDRALDRAEIVITDSGMGIEPKFADKIFEPMWTTKPEGSGFGLAIVREIVRDHDGDIELVLTPGEGAAFRITLPTRKDADFEVDREVAVGA